VNYARNAAQLTRYFLRAPAADSSSGDGDAASVMRWAR
jgi:hypothetical protein